jgi:exopolysaccharide production protein ExoQ
MRNVIVSVEAPPRIRPTAARQIPPVAASEPRPHWIERLFLGFAFLVLQGAFIGMAASSPDQAPPADSGDVRHMIAFALLLLGTVLFAPRHWRAIVRTAQPNLIYFILPLLITVSAVWSVEPLLTLKRSLLTVGVCGFDLYVATALGVDRLLRLLSWTILLTAAASIVVALALPSIGRESTQGLVGDWRGVFPQKNVLGHVMSVGVFVEMALMVRTRRLTLANVIKTLLCVLLVALAQSASSLLACFMAISLSGFYVLFRRGTVGAGICAIMVVAVMMLIGGVLAGDLPALLQLFDRDTSLTGRTDLWPYVMDAIAERPLVGWGYMAFWTPDGRDASYILNQIRWNAPNAHNGFLELALSLGVTGLIALVAIGAWSLRRGFVLILRRNDLGALLVIISVQLLAANLTESFMLSASVFGWNIFSIIVLKTGLALRPDAGAEDALSISILDRAKPNEPVADHDAIPQLQADRIPERKVLPRRFGGHV